MNVSRVSLGVSNCLTVADDLNPPNHDKSLLSEKQKAAVSTAGEECDIDRGHDRSQSADRASGG